MYERVSPAHPDKIADRIAGAIVDMAYEAEENPRIAVEVLLGHGNCFIVYESSVRLDEAEIKEAVWRITKSRDWYFVIDYNPQDAHLAENQEGGLKCGDNGIFKGCPITDEQKRLSSLMRMLYRRFPYDGKAVMDRDMIILCQSNATGDELLPYLENIANYTINPLGPWTGGPDVDTGVTGRKLGSDMGDAVTGGSIQGKDLSKADVSVNIACHLLAQAHGQACTASCAIGDEEVTFRFEDEDMTITEPYGNVVEMARNYVNDLGGFERLAEWGLI